jgi:Protein of unknown function (DUF3499)
MVRHVRRCSRTGCQDPAVATLTYVYSDSTAVSRIRTISARSTPAG